MAVPVGRDSVRSAAQTSILGLSQCGAGLAGVPTTETTMPSKTGKASSKISKHDAVLKMLRSNRGATVAELQKATGWQPHSVRGFLSGTVKKRLGLALKSEQGKTGDRRYSIAAS